MLAPNKQNLVLLKGQKKLVANGHKLLKEKRSGLIMTFLEFAQNGKELEHKVSKEIVRILKKYKLTLSFLSSETLLKNLPAKPAMALETIKKRVSGVYVDNLHLRIRPPERKNLKASLQKVLDDFGHFFPLLLELSQLKINCTRIAVQIKKTNRQISNLENKIEDINAQIKYIKLALNEKSNLEKATLIKIFP